MKDDHLARGRVFDLFDGVHDALPWADEIVVQHRVVGDAHHMLFAREDHHLRVVIVVPAPIKGWKRTVNSVTKLPRPERVEPAKVNFPEATFHFVDNAEFEPAALPPRPAYVPW